MGERKREIIIFYSSWKLNIEKQASYFLKIGNWKEYNSMMRNWFMKVNLTSLIFIVNICSWCQKNSITDQSYLISFLPFSVITVPDSKFSKILN